METAHMENSYIITLLKKHLLLIHADFTNSF